MARGFGDATGTNRDNQGNNIGAANNKITLPAIQLPLGSITIEWWSMLNISASSAILVMQNAALEALLLINVNSVGPNIDFYRFRATSLNIQETFLLGLEGSGSQRRWIHNMLVVEIGQANLPVEFFCNGDRMTYTNVGGLVQVGSGAFSTDLLVASANSWIGTNTTNTTPFNGWLNGFRIFQGALTQQVAENFSRGRNIHQFDNLLLLDVDIKCGHTTVYDRVSQTALGVSGTRNWDLQDPVPTRNRVINFRRGFHVDHIRRGQNRRVYSR